MMVLGGRALADRERELLKGNTPTLIMAVLRDGPRHGYAIARAIEQRSGAVLRCKEGTLYPALQALEREGVITGVWEQTSGGRERKVYSLTEAGLTRLADERRTWERFVEGISGVLKGDPDAHSSEEPGGGPVGMPQPIPNPVSG
jgi:PadR family transcriptional regulator PadR